MLNYKRIAARLLILGALVIGAIVSQPTPAKAITCDSACLACKHQCYLDFLSCGGLAGCDEIFADCSASCFGL